MPGSESRRQYIDGRIAELKRERFYSLLASVLALLVAVPAGIGLATITRRVLLAYEADETYWGLAIIIAVALIPPGYVLRRAWWGLCDLRLEIDEWIAKRDASNNRDIQDHAP